MRLRPVGGAVLALGLCGSVPAEANPMRIVVLGGLDKITAHVSTFEAPVGQTVSFGALRITARACDKRPPAAAPNKAKSPPRGMACASLFPGLERRSFRRL